MRPTTLKLVAGLAALAFGGGGAMVFASHADPKPPNPPGPPGPDVPKPPQPPGPPLNEEQVINKVQTSVVRLVGRSEGNRLSGTGIVIDAKQGLVLTNDHVIAGTAALEASWNGQDIGPVQIVAQAPCNDMAIVRLTRPPAGLTQLEIASSASLKPGAKVTAFGFPPTLDVQATVTPTFGNVSRVNVAVNQRGLVVPDLPVYPSVVQHTADINHGNSGGPLVNDRGQLVGMNSLGLGDFDVHGEAWAISTDEINRLLPQLKAGKSSDYVGWSLVPVALLPEVDPELAEKAAFPEAQSGLMVTGVESNSPAFRAHFERGDIVTQLDGEEVHTMADACAIVQSKQRGATFPVQILDLRADPDGGTYYNWAEPPVTL